MVKGRPLGVLEVVNKIGDTHYTEDDTIILETLAAPASLAIHNADLKRRIEAEILKSPTSTGSRAILLPSHRMNCARRWD